MSSILAIARVNVLRLVRDRSSFFFIFVLPLLIVLAIGSAFGGNQTPVLAVHDPDDSEASRLLLAALDAEDLQVELTATADAAIEDVSRGRSAGALLLPEGYGAALSTAAGASVEVEFVAAPAGAGQALRAVIEDAVASQARVVRAARFASEQVGAPFDQALLVARGADALLPGVRTRVDLLGDDTGTFEGLGRFDIGASGQLVLFVFLTSLSGSAALIQTRQWGVSRRMLSTPTPAWKILVGEGLGRVGVALLQGIYIVLGTLLIFGVDWGDPLATGALLVLFSIVSAGAGMLMGATFKNDAQAGGLGVGLGIGLAALGGSMMPLDFYSDSVRRIAHLTPHAWANDAFTEITRRAGGLGDILPELGALALFGVGFFALATWRLRLAITRV